MLNETRAPRQDTSAMAEPCLDGAFIGGTVIATALGWRAVEALAPGDRVLTFDHGMVPLTDVIRGGYGYGDAVPAIGALRPLHVPAGAVSNETAFDVLPGAYLMIESDLAEELFGDPFVLLPARALEGFAGIAPAPVSGRPPSLVRLEFAEDEIVFLRSGGLHHCPKAGDFLQAVADTGHCGPTAALTLAEAREFLAMMDPSISGHCPDGPGAAVGVARA
ncbi:Hint domain-containing protein [Wenxinia marina]|uniref:Hint domain protein n=1 Tax=Wenxinia marina DSM 24838 TaxID=1123501 RepID=A0A0D0PAL8_9RHOB|nr:Hint domain-containing protein [Wenxinia marina]KIQ68536.1 Hint domain protein [Wenxinia marina DSM 24838]GGL66700.1 hypothetical protein GCM10011392_21500 [Wenxinia marina]